MKHHKIPIAALLALVMLIFLFSPQAMKTYASEAGNELMQRIEDMLDVEVLHQEDPKTIIMCFDVNKSGYYAIGFKNNT